MAPQQITIHQATNTDWLKKSAFTTAGLFVAGLLFMAMPYNHPSAARRDSGTTGQQTSVTAAKQASNGTTGSNAKATDCGGAPSFSIMPGGLNRFLQ